MFSSTSLQHLPSCYLLLRSATIIILIVSMDIASSNKVQHRTKEAESKVNELYCYSCDMIDSEQDCLNINQTRTKHVNFTKKCAQDEIYCSVKRFSYTMSDKNTTSEKKLWTLQRDCKKNCENACIIIGERVKIHACETCCTSNLCNVGSFATKVKFNHPIAKLFMLLILTAFFTNS